jgi:phosphosulfolactate synthase
VDRLIFETPQVDQQAWFITRFGRDVNLGNIPPEEVIPLETLRLGLRSHTMPKLLLKDLENQDAQTRT